MMKRSLSASLRATLAEERSCAALARLDEARIAALAARIVAEDSYGEAAHLLAALARMGLDAEEARVHVEHRIHCAWREARFRTGAARVSDLRVRFEGASRAKETEGAPTIIVAPMTLDLHDAMAGIAYFMEQYFPGRRHIVYGEEMDGSELADPAIRARWAGKGKAAARAVIETLDAGGVFFTYADFVYEGHPALMAPLFDAPYPISSGFVSFASRPGTMLLPCLLERDGDGVMGRIFEACRLDGQAFEGASRAEVREAVAGLVAGILEDLIRLAGPRWLLLPTLTFEAPQRTREPSPSLQSTHRPL